MEEKQLNFNQPLLSVRRSASTLSSDTDNRRKIDNSVAYKSESAPLRNPGTVPFVWERIPGRPKDETKLKMHNVVEQRLPIIPKLPPGRVSKVKQQDSDKEVSKDTSSVYQSITGWSVSNSQSVSSMDKNVTKHERPKDAIQEKVTSGSDDGDEAIVDALDTLSRTESFFMNCSLSGLSGLADQDFQPFGSFLADQQARDFMIGRFLPAAKAMASETPHYAPRKPPVAREQPRQLKNVALSRETSHSLNQHRPRVLPHYVQDVSWIESEDEGDNYNGSQSYAPKVCGLLPWFCLLNPIPGLRMQYRVPSSSVHDIQTKSSAFHSGTGKEHARTANHVKKLVESKSGFAEERDFLGVPENFKYGIHPHGKDRSKLSACESTQYESRSAKPVAEKTLYIDSVHKAKSHSNSDSSEIKGQNGLGDDSKTSNKDNDIWKNPLIDPSLQYSKHLGIVDEKAASQTGSKVAGDGKVDMKRKWLTELDSQESSDTNHLKLPLALPSPKPPAESWLKRTLATISSKNTSPRPSLAARILLQNQLPRQHHLIQSGKQ